jgi:LmbE family N-acetylglucosaminyl deacetylase
MFGGVEREPFSLPAKVLHEEWKLERPVSYRRLEDAAACLVLGCESSFCEFPDAIYRQDADGRHLYPTFESLRGSIAPEDSVLAEQLAAQVKCYLSDRNTVVYCPLAIGGHIDHVVVRDCGTILKTHESTVVFYRDFYYDQQWIGETEDVTMTCVNVTLTRDEIGKKLAAVSEYKSQISDLFGTQASMTSYFAETGKRESFFLPQQADPVLLARLRSALARV